LPGIHLAETRPGVDRSQKGQNRPSHGCIVVARIAPEPISTTPAVTDYRSRPMAITSIGPVVPDALMPPAVTPVPVPVPGPAIVPPSEAFAAALIAARFQPATPSAAEVSLRQTSGWQPPDSDLHLADREV
jgi:hypothetical protein